MAIPFTIKSRDQSRSPRTIQNYLSRYRRLEKLALIRNNYFGAPKWEWDDIKPPVEVVIDELRRFAKKAKKVNFITYRSAVLYNITHDLLGQGFIEQDKAMELIGIVKLIEAESDEKKSSSKAQSNISLRDLNKLTKALHNYSGRSMSGMGTNYWIQATIACGLRPNEWESAKIVPAQIQEHPDHHFNLHCKKLQAQNTHSTQSRTSSPT